MTIEEFFVDYLNDAQLGAAAHGSVPHPLPDSFITVEKSGESVTNYVPTATLLVQSWSTSRAAAATLCVDVIAAMLASPGRPEISSCALTASYNNTDLATHKPRYAARFEVVYLF